MSSDVRKPVETSRVQLFVVTAYRLDQLYAAKRSIVERLAAQHDMQAHYAVFQAPLLHGGFNLAETLSIIRSVDLIIADLSYERPSCYYEVGFAHGLGKPVELIAFDATFAEYQPLAEVQFIDQLRLYRDLATYSDAIGSILASHSPSSRGVATMGHEQRAACCGLSESHPITTAADDVRALDA